MSPQPKRHIEVRMLVVAIVDVTSPELIDTLKLQPEQPSSMAAVVAKEVVSNLESVPYIYTAIVSHL